MLRMRRHYIWYLLAVGWGVAAIAGFVRNHATQAAPAAVFAITFVIVGIVIGRRDTAIRNRRTGGR